MYALLIIESMNQKEAVLDSRYEEVESRNIRVMGSNQHRVILID
jgi:hypothetical protein